MCGGKSAVTSIDAVRRVDPDAAGVEVQLAADPAGQERLGPAIFGVADDRMTDRRHVRAKLVGAAGQRLQLDPGGAVAGAVDDPPARAGRRAILLVDMHLLAAGAGLLGERGVDQALVERGHADDQRPIDLARGPAGEGLGEMACGPRGLARRATRRTCPCRGDGRAWAGCPHRRPARRAGGRDAGGSWSRPASRGPEAC